MMVTKKAQRAITMIKEQTKGVKKVEEEEEAEEKEEVMAEEEGEEGEEEVLVVMVVVDFSTHHLNLLLPAPTFLSQDSFRKEIRTCRLLKLFANTSWPSRRQRITCPA
jgi:hypothetical protein